eukprot:m.200030 g.200030  ORF g.200030 m.200030 type:complete len:84 (+) comp14952_c1_seq5:441-692(+)
MCSSQENFTSIPREGYCHTHILGLIRCTQTDLHKASTHQHINTLGQTNSTMDMPASTKRTKSRRKSSFSPLFWRKKKGKPKSV